jgi:hypothetical protein
MKDSSNEKVVDFLGAGPSGCIYLNEADVRCAADQSIQ